MELHRAVSFSMLNVGWETPGRKSESWALRGRAMTPSRLLKKLSQDSSQKETPSNLAQRVECLTQGKVSTHASSLQLSQVESAKFKAPQSNAWREQIPVLPKGYKLVLTLWLWRHILPSP